MGSVDQTMGCLPPVQKLKLLNLTSDVDEEWLAASKIQHKVPTEAYRLMSTADCRRRRSWWASEVHHLVGSHMGWLGKILSRVVLGKCADGGRPKGSLALGEEAPSQGAGESSRRALGSRAPSYDNEPKQATPQGEREGVHPLWA